MKKSTSRYGALKVAFATTVFFLISILATGFSFGQGAAATGAATVNVQNPPSGVPLDVRIVGRKSNSVKTITKEIIVHDTITVVNNIYSQPDPNAPLKVDPFRMDYVNGTVVGTGIVDMKGIPIGQIGQVSKEQPTNASWMDQAKQQVTQQSMPTNGYFSGTDTSWIKWLVGGALIAFILWLILGNRNRPAPNNNCNYNNEHERRYAQNAPQPPGNQQGNGNVYSIPFNMDFEVYQRGVSPHNCPPRQ